MLDKIIFTQSEFKEKYGITVLPGTYIVNVTFEGGPYDPSVGDFKRDVLYKTPETTIIVVDDNFQKVY